MEPNAEGAVYQALRKSILEFDAMPGERLSERGLERMLGASRTPIRAALIKLEAEGLTGREGRGWRVAPIDLTEVRAVMEYRDTLEIGITRLAVERATDAELRSLAEPLGTQYDVDDQAISLRDGSDFHRSLAQLSGNPFLRDAVASTLTRLARPRWLAVGSAASRARVRHDHREILDALLERDADRACALVSAHTRATRERLVAYLTEERARLRGRGLAIVES